LLNPILTWYWGRHMTLFPQVGAVVRTLAKAGVNSSQHHKITVAELMA